MRWSNFLKYNNIVPITISLLLLSFGTSLAASPEIRSDVAASVISTQTQVVAIDNTYIVNKDLSTYTPRALIEGVTEDSDFYYVQYAFSTIDIKDSVWQDVVKDETIKVQKEALEGGDLGVYVTKKLAERIANEMDLLRQTQQIEKAQVSQKVVATVYGGLIGKFLDDTTKTLPGYVPVVTPPAPVPTEQSDTGGQAPDPAQSGTVSLPGNGGVPPTIQILGDNPAHLNVGDTYSDLGVVVTDSLGHNLGDTLFLDGVQTPQIQIDTKVAGTHTVKYVAVDTYGNRTEATKVVIVGAPAQTGQTASSTPDAASSSPSGSN